MSVNDRAFPLRDMQGTGGQETKLRRTCLDVECSFPAERKAGPMRLISLIGLIIMTATLSAFGNESEREVKQIEDQIGEAIVKRDAAFVERIWAEEFVYTGVRGEVKSKAEILAELKAGDLKFEEMKFDEVRIRVFGDAAVVTGRATTKGRSKQGEISGRFRYTRVYVKREGAWQLVSFQGTAIAASK